MHPVSKVKLNSFHFTAPSGQIYLMLILYFNHLLRSVQQLKFTLSQDEAYLWLLMAFCTSCPLRALMPSFSHPLYNPFPSLVQFSSSPTPLGSISAFSISLLSLSFIIHSCLSLSWAPHFPHLDPLSFFLSSNLCPPFTLPLAFCPSLLPALVSLTDCRR